MQHALSILMILAGAIIMLISMLEAKNLQVLTPFIPERHRESVAKGLRLHRGLMAFFLPGYLVVAMAFLYNIAFVGEFFVGAVFLFGAIFVYVGIRLQSRMLLEIKNTLHGLLPICSNCKKMRSPESDPKNPQSWQNVESFLSSKTDADFTHSVCPECLKELYPDLYDE